MVGVKGATADTSKPVCEMCSFGGRPGQGRAWAVWLFKFVDGTLALLCTRHKNQAVRAGGWCCRLSRLPEFEWYPAVVDESVARSAKPEPREDRERRQLLATVRAEVERYMGEFSFEVHPVFREQRRSA